MKCAVRQFQAKINTCILNNLVPASYAQITIFDVVITQALVDRLHSARTQHEQLVRLHDEAMAKVVASGAAASATEAREELAEIREEVVGLRDAAHRDAALRSAARVEARDEATRETHRADAATFALDNARHALVKTETTAREREKMHEEALGEVQGKPAGASSENGIDAEVPPVFLY